MQRELVHAYILHRRPYRDTSALIDIFTREHGRVTVVARGVQSSRNAWRGVLQPFRPLLLAWSGRGELFTLTQAESAGAPLSLPGAVLLSGLYVNELLVKLVARDDPHAVLFDRYLNTLAELARATSIAREAAVLRLFERDLLRELGFGVVLDTEARSGAPLQRDSLYCYLPEQGPIAASGFADEMAGCAVHGATLLALNSGDLSDERALRESKLVLRAALDHHLGHRQVASRQLRRAWEELSSSRSHHES